MIAKRIEEIENKIEHYKSELREVRRDIEEIKRGYGIKCFSHFELELGLEELFDTEDYILYLIEKYEYELESLRESQEFEETGF